jgi:hypothetical protein
MALAAKPGQFPGFAAGPTRLGPPEVSQLSG